MAPKAARTVLEAADEGDAATAAAKRPRVLKRQSTEQAVAKALRDNCAGMTPQEVDGVRVSGMTLREKLLSDKREARIGSRAEPMGRKYYDGLREAYSSAACAMRPTFGTEPMVFGSRAPCFLQKSMTA